MDLPEQRDVGISTGRDPRTSMPRSGSMEELKRIVKQIRSADRVKAHVLICLLAFPPSGRRKGSGAPTACRSKAFKTG